MSQRPSTRPLYSMRTLDQDDAHEEMQHERHVNEAKKSPAKRFDPVLRLTLAEDAHREHDHRQGQQLRRREARFEIARGKRMAAPKSVTKPVEGSQPRVSEHRVKLLRVSTLMAVTSHTPPGAPK